MKKTIRFLIPLMVIALALAAMPVLLAATAATSDNSPATTLRNSATITTPPVAGLDANPAITLASDKAGTASRAYVASPVSNTNNHLNVATTLEPAAAGEVAPNDSAASAAASPSGELMQQDRARDSLFDHTTVNNGTQAQTESAGEDGTLARDIVQKASPDNATANVAAADKKNDSETRDTTAAATDTENVADVNGSELRVTPAQDADTTAALNADVNIKLQGGTQVVVATLKTDAEPSDDPGSPVADEVEQDRQDSR